VRFPLEAGHNVVVHEDPDILDFRNETVLVKVDDRALTVGLETLAEQRLDFSPGDDVYVTFVRPDALYRFPSRVLGVNETRGTLTLQRNDDGISRIQRRTYFRMHVRLHVHTRRLSEISHGRRVSIEKTAEAVDLSGGGIQLRLDEPYQRGDLLELSLRLPDGGDAIRLVGKVVRVKKLERAEGITFSCGVEFVKIKESDRSRIIRFLFLTQARKPG